MASFWGHESVFIESRSARLQTMIHYFAGGNRDVQCLGQRHSIFTLVLSMAKKGEHTLTLLLLTAAACCSPTERTSHTL